MLLTEGEICPSSLESLEKCNQELSQRAKNAGERSHWMTLGLTTHVMNRGANGCPVAGSTIRCSASMVGPELSVNRLRLTKTSPPRADATSACALQVPPGREFNFWSRPRKPYVMTASCEVAFLERRP